MKGVYLIHFGQKYKHAQHYIGYATDVRKRIKRHYNGQGARLIQVIQEHGIVWCVARIWKRTKEFEKILKNRKNAKRYCPICKKKIQEKNYVK